VRFLFPRPVFGSHGSRLAVSVDGSGETRWGGGSEGARARDRDIGVEIDREREVECGVRIVAIAPPPTEEPCVLRAYLRSVFSFSSSFRFFISLIFCASELMLDALFFLILVVDLIISLFFSVLFERS